MSADLLVLHGPWADPENPGWLWRVIDDGKDRPVLQSRNEAADNGYWQTNGSGVASRELVRLKEEALPDAFAACEALVAAGLLALAEAEEARARETGGMIRQTRAACLREAALAVSLGQFRTAEANEAAGKGK